MWQTFLVLLFSLLRVRGDDSLESVIYKSFIGNPCVWLLDNEGGHGCHTTKDGRVGVLRYISNETALQKFLENSPSRPQVLVMESKLALPSLPTLIKNEASIAGVLVLEGGPPQFFSPAEKTPGSNVSTHFAWNPKGNGLLKQQFPFPLWALGVDDSVAIKEKAIANENRTSYPYYAAELVAFMHPRTEDTSFTSIRQSTSKPIGGHSTLTTVRPYNETTEKEVVLAIAGMDSASLFQMKTIGANGDMSGTVALMAALEALLQPDQTPILEWKRHPLFIWFDAEHWGSLGSTQFIHDLRNFTCLSPQGEGASAFCENPWAPSTAFQKIKYNKIHSIIEPKQVGAPSSGELYVHQQTHSFNTPAATTTLNVKVPGLLVNRASAETDSVPPSSLLSFIQFDASLASKGVVIADHPAEYANQFYNSIFDTFENVNSDLVCKAASAIAQTVSALGRDVDPSTQQSHQTGTITVTYAHMIGQDAETGRIAANCTLVSQLLDCLTRNNSCELRQEFLPGLKGKKTDEFPVHYASVYFPSAYSEHQKFIHDWVADCTAIRRNTSSCQNDDDCDQDAKETCLRNHCQKPESTFYHEAKNLNCDYEIGAFSAYFVVHNTSDPAIFWTESDWTPIGLRIFLVTDPSIDYVFLGIALVEVAIVFGLSFIANRFFSQKFKIL